VSRAPLPVRLEREDDGRIVVIQWDGRGHAGRYAARDLRLACACAACVEEMSGRPILDPGTVPGDIAARALRLVGAYALHIAWSDGHDSGIYPWDRLYALCPCPDCAARREAG